MAKNSIYPARKPAPKRTGPGLIAHPKTLGMKPAHFGALKSIINQPIGGKKPDWVGNRQKPKKEPKKGLLEEAKRRFTQAAEAEATTRKDSLDDLKFLAGDQWDAKIRRSREQDSRPCLTINRLPQFVRQVTNEQRQNRLGVQVDPIGDGADEEIAEVLEGMIRHIEYDSGADAAYDKAFEGAASIGFGYWLITTEYCDENSFDQDIKIKRIRNPFTVYMDPSAKEPDYSDANFCFLVEKLSKDEFKAEFKNAELTKMEDWSSVGDTTGWIDKDEVRIASYYYKERTPVTIAQVKHAESGETFVAPSSELPEKLPEGWEIVNIRQSEEITIQWAKINGLEVLDETVWPGKWIPVVKVVGDEFDIDGHPVLKGIVRDAKEPQRQFNYFKSAVTEAIALAPKAPFVGIKGQFTDSKWKNANVKNYAYLEADPVTIGGSAAPVPQRQTAEPAIQAMAVAMSESADDLKAVTGVYDAALGAQGNEQSGKAILARQQQVQSGTFHYGDNLVRALRHSGRIIVDLIPKIYDTARLIRIVNPDESIETVQINQAFQEGEVQKIYDLTAGKYDVRIEAGPSFQTRRQEAVESMLTLIQAEPTLAGVIGDLVVGQMDFPGAQPIADRLKKMLPPGLADDNGNGLPPEAQAQIQQLATKLQETTQQLAAAQQDIQQKISVKKLDTDSREKIEASKVRIEEMRIKLEQEKLQTQIVLMQLKMMADRGDSDAQRLYDYLSQLDSQNHDAALTQMQHEHSMQQSQFAVDNAPEPSGDEE